MIILIIIALGLLKYFFDWSLVDFLKSEQGKNVASFLKGILDTAWHYLSKPLAFLWDEVVWPMIKYLIEFGKESPSASN